MVWTKEWLLNKIKYYRKLYFFEQYNNLSDDDLANMIIKINDKYYQWQDFHSPPDHSSNDWQLLTMMDRKRLSCVDTGLIYGSPPGLYSFDTFVSTLSELANISRNIFCPKNIIEINENNVAFTLGNQRYKINPQETWYDPILVASQINLLISNTGFQFEFWNLSPDVYILVVNREEKTLLINDGNWW